MCMLNIFSKSRKSWMITQEFYRKVRLWDWRLKKLFPIFAKKMYWHYYRASNRHSLYSIAKILLDTYPKILELFEKSQPLIPQIGAINHATYDCRAKRTRLRVSFEREWQLWQTEEERVGKSPLAEEVGITRRGRWSYARVGNGRSSFREDVRKRDGRYTGAQ